MTTQDVLTVTGARKKFGNVTALDGATLSLKHGELLALLGPNGAGKTTLMHSIVGLHKPCAGSVYLEGERLNRLSPHAIVQRGVVLVPEGRHIFANMRVIENLELGAYAPAARRERAASLERVFAIFPSLLERTNQIAGSLSGGQQQMLAIGRALMGRPRLLLLDEPSLGLGPLVVRDMFAVIREVNREGVTVVLVEQNARLALQMADHAYILEQGRVAGHGAGAALLQDDRVRRAYLGDVVKA